MNYIKLDQVTNILFYQVPQVLFVGKYKSMSNNARMTYAVLRDRMNLSIKNNWSDKHGNVYILFSRENLAERLGVARTTVIRHLQELIKLELIEERRQGFNKPNVIYVMTPVDIENTRTSGKRTSGSPKNGLHEVQKPDPSNTNLNNTNLNNTYKRLGNGNRVSFEVYLQSSLEEEDLEEQINCTKYYIKKYKDAYMEDLLYSISQWNEIITGLFVTDRDHFIDEDIMINAINKHFDTEYKYKEMYLLHNFTETTKENRLFEVGVLS